MRISRREFVGGAAGAALAGKAPGFRIGVMDGVLRLGGKPEALALAASLGFEGVEVTIGRSAAGGVLPLADPELQGRYLDEARKHKLRLAGAYLDILHVNCLKNDKLALEWVSDGIRITRRLNARVLLVVFFGKCALSTPQELDAVTGAFKELAPEAERAGVTLGFENTLSAEDSARVLDRVGSKALKVYYDVGNSTNMGGFDAVKELRWLGRERICQVHLKDKGYLGEGKVDFPGVVRALADIGFTGFANLETSSPSGSVENDLRRNLAYLRRLCEMM
jgi:sugar phosphate isomerase/epimerase